MPERQKRVTLKDVADYCGLSRSLVAFIISNSGYRNSTPENRRKVAEAVKALNYRPNTAARELRARKSSTIGVAMPMSGTGFYGNIALELQREIKRRGFTSLFSFWGGDDPEEMHAESLRALFSRNIDGVISWDASPRFREEGIPAVIYGGALKKRKSSWLCIYMHSAQLKWLDVFGRVVEMICLWAGNIFKEIGAINPAPCFREPYGFLVRYIVC